MGTVVQQTNGEKTIYTADEYTLVQNKFNDIYNTQLPLKANKTDIPDVSGFAKETDLQTTNAQLADIANGQIITPSMSVSDIQNAINTAYENNTIVRATSGTFNINGNLIFKVPIIGDYWGNTVFLFGEGYGFTNFESNGSAFYNVGFLKHITIESDKSAHWNATEAGQVWDTSVTDTLAKRVYGQRLFIGNNHTTASNNITPSSNKNNPFGFWDQDYSQWNSNTGLDLTSNGIYNSSLFTGINKKDTNTIYAPNGIELDNVSFIGFSIGLTVKGGYPVDISNCQFSRCNIGFYGIDGGTLPGSLASAGTKITTAVIEKSLFEDISFCGIIADSVTESQFKENTFQPCKIGKILVAGANNHIYDNYHEICYIGTYFNSSTAYDCHVHHEFANPSYCTYNVYLLNGIRNKIENLKSNKSVYAAAGIQNCDFDGTCSVTLDPNYFWVNGNSIERQKPKTSIVKITGVSGTSMSLSAISSTRQNNAYPSIIQSYPGIQLSGNETILSVESMSADTNAANIGYYNVGGGGYTDVLYFSQFDSTNKVFTELDVRTNGQVIVLRVTYLDGVVTGTAY